MCTQLLMHVIASRSCTNTVRESALTVDSGRKSTAVPGHWICNLYQQCTTSNTQPTELHPTLTVNINFATTAWEFSLTFLHLPIAMGSFTCTARGMKAVIACWSSTRLLTERLWVRFLAGVVGEFSSPELTFCADFYLVSVPPCVTTVAR